MPSNLLLDLYVSWQILFSVIDLAIILNNSVDGDSDGYSFSNRKSDKSSKLSQFIIPLSILNKSSSEYKIVKGLLLRYWE